MGYLFQQYALFPNMTVRQNIAAAVRDRARRQAAVAEKLRQFQLEAVADQKPGQLSGGQQQRCALARILASEPKAILLDEPFSALDSYLKYQLELELADTLGEFPGTVLWVSHDRGEVFRNCRRVCVMDRGRSQPVTDPGGAVPLPRHGGRRPALRVQELRRTPGPRGMPCSCRSGAVTLALRPPGAGGRLPDRHPGPPCPARRPRAGRTAFPCTVERVVEDVFSTIVLLRPEGAAPEAPLLRMELDKDAWQAVPDKSRLTVSVPPEAILLLES